MIPICVLATLKPPVLDCTCCGNILSFFNLHSHDLLCGPLRPFPYPSRVDEILIELRELLVECRTVQSACVKSAQKHLSHVEADRQADKAEVTTKGTNYPGLPCPWVSPTRISEWPSTHSSRTTPEIHSPCSRPDTMRGKRRCKSHQESLLLLQLSQDSLPGDFCTPC